MWAWKALVLTVKGGIGVLAATGAVAIYAAVMLMTGHWGVEEILTGVAYLERGQAWIAGISGTGIAAAFSRFGFPVLAQILSDRKAARQAAAEDSLVERLAARLSSPPR